MNAVETTFPALCRLGLITVEAPPPHKKGTPWTDGQRAKAIRSLRKKWSEKKARGERWGGALNKEAHAAAREWLALPDEQKRYGMYKAFCASRKVHPSTVWGIIRRGKKV